jgi:hypothetical protein
VPLIGTQTTQLELGQQQHGHPIFWVHQSKYHCRLYIRAYMGMQFCSIGCYWHDQLQPCSHRLHPLQHTISGVRHSLPVSLGSQHVGVRWILSIAVHSR